LVGQRLADIGNSGNTPEPHEHVQLMDSPIVTVAAGVPVRWNDIEPGLPADGQVFTTTDA
jgi:hypothetical protein